MRLPLAALLFFGSTICAASCTVLVDADASQCTRDSDCRGNTVCDRAMQLCVDPARGAPIGGNCTATDKPLVSIEGDITADFVLTCDKDYRISGQVNVQSGVTLTIDRGTQIKGARGSTLVVQRGGRLVAVGTPDEPIVFTSDQPDGEKTPGHWGGLMLLGYAPVNALAPSPIEGTTAASVYGGDDEGDSSGILKYIRLEYGGYNIAPNNEANGLTFGGVGSGTIVDHIQVRRCSDDCFEFFGGTVNASHLICSQSGDDGFDWDNGYRGKLQFLVLQQDPRVVDETNGFEGDNDAMGTTNEPISGPTIYNATLCGSNVDVAKEQYGMLLRRGTRAQVFNVIVTGFEAGIDLRNAVEGIELRNSIFYGNLLHNVAYPESPDGEPGTPEADDDSDFDERAWFAASGNREIDPELGDCFHPEDPDFAPKNPLNEGAAIPPRSDSFFDPNAAYIGAVRDARDRWMSGKWVVWSAD